jgi:hypothetical protein
MNNDNTQLTVRGIDLRTKQQLTRMAANKGISLNNLLVGALKQAAGTTTADERLELIRATLHSNKISNDDIIDAETTIAEMDAVSKEKQKCDEHDFSF